MFKSGTTLAAGGALKRTRYAWTVVDLADPLRTKESDKVASAFQAYYKRGPLKWQKILTCGPWTLYVGVVSSVASPSGVASEICT